MSPAEALKIEPPKTCRAFENTTPRILKDNLTERGNQEEGEEEDEDTSTPRIAVLVQNLLTCLRNVSF